MKISEVQIGHKFNHPKWGEGIVTNRTAKTISAVFTNGNRSKVTYRSKEGNFSPFDFS